MAVKVVADSASDIPAELAEELGISVVPCTVFFGAEAFKDGVEITKDEFFNRLTTGNIMPTTTQPSVGDFLDVYRPLAEAGHDIVSVHVSGKLSGTVNSARLAAEELPNTTVEIVDTELASMGAALAAKAAADAISGGADAAGAAEAARNAAANTEVYFVPETLEYLKRGGRIGGAQALLGSLLSMKPILTLVDGEVHPQEKVRTKAKAVQRMRNIGAEKAPYREAAVIHRVSDEEAGAMAEHLAQFTANPVISAPVGASVGAHTGPGVIGFALWKGE